MRVFQRDSDGELEFAGTDAIDHTPKDETVSLRLGYAFDLAGERKQLAQRNGFNWNEQDWEIKLRNHTPDAVKIDVVESHQRQLHELGHAQGEPGPYRPRREHAGVPRRAEGELRGHGDVHDPVSVVNRAAPTRPGTPGDGANERTLPMKRYRSLALLLAAAALVAVGTGLAAPEKPPAALPDDKPQPDDKPGVHLTIYNDNYALVKDRRELPDVFKAGVNIIQFRDVAATLDPTSVHFRSLTDPAAQVTEQNYEFDLVSADKLLQKYIDQKITAHTRDGKSYEGTLLSFDAQRLVIAEDREKGPIYMVERGDNIKRIAFSQLPDGLLTRPTLVWEVEAKKAGKHLVEVSYIANGIRWRADYNVVLNEGDTKADVSGWVTVENGTGTTFDKAPRQAAGRRPQARLRAHALRLRPQLLQARRDRRRPPPASATTPAAPSATTACTRCPSRPPSATTRSSRSS